MTTIRRTLIGGRVQLPTLELAVVLAINTDGLARVAICGLTGLEALRDIPQQFLRSVPWSSLIDEDGEAMLHLGDIT